MRRIFPFLLCLLLVPISAFAGTGDIYRCQFEVSSRSLISQQVLIAVEHATGKVLVFDAFIHGVIGEPIEGKVVSNDSKKIAFRWSLHVPDRSGTIARLTYRLAYFKESGMSTISAQAMGFRNNANSRGKCTVKQGEV